jgi:hypothetical protein
MTQPEKHEVNSLSSRFRHVYWVEATKPRFRKGRLPLWVTCGRRPGKNFLTLCSIGRVRSRVRPVDAAGMAAGPNALRGSGPKQNRAL